MSGGSVITSWKHLWLTSNFNEDAIPGDGTGGGNLTICLIHIVAKQPQEVELCENVSCSTYVGLRRYEAMVNRIHRIASLPDRSSTSDMRPRSLAIRTPLRASEFQWNARVLLFIADACSPDDFESSTDCAAGKGLTERRFYKALSSTHFSLSVHCFLALPYSVLSSHVPLSRTGCCSHRRRRREQDCRCKQIYALLLSTPLISSPLVRCASSLPHWLTGNLG